MKIKIVSEGRGATTKVIDADTGEPLQNIDKVSWSVEAKGLANAVVEFINVPVDVIGEFLPKTDNEAGKDA